MTAEDCGGGYRKVEEEDFFGLLNWVLLFSTQQKLDRLLENLFKTFLVWPWQAVTYFLKTGQETAG